MCLVLFVWHKGFSQADSGVFICNYLQESPPINEPYIFAKGIVSVDNKNTHALVFSPDCKTIIFSRYPEEESYVMSYCNNGWTKPEKTPFKGKEISFSHDGKKIFYYNDGDIFYVEYDNNVFSRPEALDSLINTRDTTEYYPCVTENGNLYFSRNSKWNEGKIFFSEFKNNRYQEPVQLNPDINEGGALHSFVAKEENYILFNSARKGSYTMLDIWISFKKENGQWTIPVNLGEKINYGADAVLCL